LWLTNLLTNNKGETLFFLPAFGYLLLIMGTGLFLLNHWDSIREAGWGDKKVLVSLLFIVLFMGISGLIHGDTVSNKLAPLLMGLVLVAVYFMSRQLGIQLFRMLIPFVIIGSVISTILTFANPNQLTGGLITNGCASAGFLIFGTLANQGKWQWLLCLVAIVGIFFVGTLEAVFILSVLGAVIIIRKDFHKRLLVISFVLVFVLLLCSFMGYMDPLYNTNPNIATLSGIISGGTPLNTATMDALTTGRWTINMNAIRDIQFLGHGFTLNVEKTTAHNIPLIIIDQIGVIAALAWLFVTLYCLIKTKWKYMWIAILAMSVFDHYLWTQFLPWWFVLAGVSLTSNIKSDLIFRKEDVVC